MNTTTPENLPDPHTDAIEHLLSVFFALLQSLADQGMKPRFHPSTDDALDLVAPSWRHRPWGDLALEFTIAKDAKLSPMGATMMQSAVVFLARVVALELPEIIDDDAGKVEWFHGFIAGIKEDAEKILAPLQAWAAQHEARMAAAGAPTPPAEPVRKIGCRLCRAFEGEEHKPGCPMIRHAQTAAAVNQTPGECPSCKDYVGQCQRCGRLTKTEPRAEDWRA